MTKKDAFNWYWNEYRIDMWDKIETYIDEHMEGQYNTRTKKMDYVLEFFKKGKNL